MIKSKKIVTEVFPRLETTLPKSLTDKYLKQANDGMLLYAPRKTMDGRKVGDYYCLKCGTHGEIEGENIMCLNCTNMDARPFVHGSGGGSSFCRIVSFVEPYLVLRDFQWYVDENAETGAEVCAFEVYRIFLTENDYALYENENYHHGFMNGNAVWKKRKKIFDRRKIRDVYYADIESKKHTITHVLKVHFDKGIEELCEALNKHYAVLSEKKLEMPEVSFPKIDYSQIKEIGRWEVREQKTQIPSMTGFVKRSTWCTRCGKYHEVIEEDRGYYSSESCTTCGHPYVQEMQKTFLIVDAVETENSGVMLRLHCTAKASVFVGPLIVGIDPQVEMQQKEIFTEYVYVSPEGTVAMYNHNGDEIDRLGAPKGNGHGEMSVMYSSEVKDFLKSNEAIKRTGFAELLDGWATPKYFEYLKQMPCLEIFSKMGMNALVCDILRKDLSDIPQYLKKTGKDSRLAKLSKPQIKSLRRSQVLLKQLLAYMRVINRDPDALYEDFIVLANRSHERHVLDIMCVGVPGLTIAKIREYIDRVDDAQCCPPSESMQLWSDYLRMLKNLEADLTDSKLVFTNSLKREHDKAARKLQQVNNDRLCAAFEKQATSNEWLAYKGKRLSAIIPHQITELYEEGRKLNHCVGSYARLVSEGSSIIAFVRKNNALDSPYCTVEIRNKSVVQARGVSNRAGLLFPGIKEFLEEWSAQKGLTVDVA